MSSVSHWQWVIAYIWEGISKESPPKSQGVPLKTSHNWPNFQSLKSYGGIRIRMNKTKLCSFRIRINRNEADWSKDNIYKYSLYKDLWLHTHQHPFPELFLCFISLIVLCSLSSLIYVWYAVCLFKCEKFSQLADCTYQGHVLYIWLAFDMFNPNLGSIIQK